MFRSDYRGLSSYSRAPLCLHFLASHWIDRSAPPFPPSLPGALHCVAWGPFRVCQTRLLRLCGRFSVLSCVSCSKSGNGIHIQIVSLKCCAKRIKWYRSMPQPDLSRLPRILCSREKKSLSASLRPPDVSARRRLPVCRLPDKLGPFSPTWGAGAAKKTNGRPRTAGQMGARMTRAGPFGTGGCP